MLDWGGTCTLLGVPKLGTEASFVVNTLYNDKSILGCRYGSTRPHHDIPLLVRFYQDGRLQLDEMVSQRYPLGDIQPGPRRHARRQAQPRRPRPHPDLGDNVPMEFGIFAQLFVPRFERDVDPDGRAQAHHAQRRDLARRRARRA